MAIPPAAAISVRATLAMLDDAKREGAQPDIAPKERKNREEVALSEAERAAQQLREAIEGPLNPERELTGEEVTRKIEDEEERADFERKPAQGELYGYNRPGKKDQRERQNLAMRDSEERGAQAKIEGPKGRAQNSRADAQPARPKARRLLAVKFAVLWLTAA